MKINLSFIRSQDAQYVIDLWKYEYERHCALIKKNEFSRKRENKSFRVKGTVALDAFLVTLQLQEKSMHDAFFKDKTFCSIMSKVDVTEWMADVVCKDPECLEWGLGIGWGRYWSISATRMRGADMLFTGRETSWRARDPNWRPLSPALQDAWLERYVSKVTHLVDYIKTPSDAAIQTVLSKGSKLSDVALFNIFHTRPEWSSLAAQLLNIDTSKWPFAKSDVEMLNHFVETNIKHAESYCTPDIALLMD